MRYVNVRIYSSFTQRVKLLKINMTNNGVDNLERIGKGVLVLTSICISICSCIVLERL